MHVDLEQALEVGEAGRRDGVGRPSGDLAGVGEQSKSPTFAPHSQRSLESRAKAETGKQLTPAEWTQ